jgi:two-component system response regulator GlrR
MRGVLIGGGDVPHAAHVLEFAGVRDGATEDLSSGAVADAAPVNVTVSDGPDKGRSVLLSKGAMVVGAGGDCDLVLTDGAISRRHVQLELIPGGVRLKDLGSRNGTHYLGAKVDQVLVPIGGSITLGRTTLSLLPPSSAVALSTRDELQGLVGRSVAMRALFAQLERLGPAATSALLQGETGTGKTAVARALHELSPRAKEPFVVVDCGTLSPQLIESELFGHAKGAFTGADKPRAGAVEAASSGTLFLDEVAELPLELQPKLLRVLDGGDFRRVGENLPRKARCLVHAATHKDLEAAVQAGRFRQDLYYRLAVAVVRVPALRERPEDIPLLVEHFAKARGGVKLSAATIAAFQCDAWPGNVRELRNAVERALALGDANETQALPAGVAPSLKEARDKLLEDFERDYLRTLLERNGDNYTEAAKIAGISRAQFYRLLERYGLSQARDNG